MLLNPLAEHYSDKVLSSQDTEQQAIDLVHQLQSKGIASRQIELIAPNENRLGEKLEPEQDRIAQTAVRAHLLLAVLGIGGAMLIATFLIYAGPAFTTSNPVFTFIAAGIMGAFAGLLGGGLISLRPDQDRFLMKALASRNKQLWTLVVHTQGRREKREAQKIIRNHEQMA